MYININNKVYYIICDPSFTARVVNNWIVFVLLVSSYGNDYYTLIIQILFIVYVNIIIITRI